MKQRWIGAGAAGAGMLGVWAAFENTALLRTARYHVPLRGLPRTVQLSDLHRRCFGAHQRRLLRAVRTLRPACIVVTGDLVSRTETDFTETERFVRDLCTIAPVLTVCGNHEADLPPELFSAYRNALRRGGAISLDNRMLRVGTVTFAGLSLPSAYYRGGGVMGFTGKYNCTTETLRQRLGDCPPDTVLLAHNPLWFPAYAEWGAALTLSGHVHGGAVRLPLLGGILSPERKFFPRYDKGYFTQGSAAMIVSGGLGKLRLFNPPEICLVTGTMPL